MATPKVAPGGGDLLGGAAGDGAAREGDAGCLEAEIFADHGLGEILAGWARLHQGDGGGEGGGVEVEVATSREAAEDFGQVTPGVRGE